MEISAASRHRRLRTTCSCSKIIEQLVARFVSGDEEMTQDIPVPVFSILQLCAVCDARNRVPLLRSIHKSSHGLETQSLGKYL